MLPLGVGVDIASLGLCAGTLEWVISAPQGLCRQNCSIGAGTDHHGMRQKHLECCLWVLEWTLQALDCAFALSPSSASPPLTHPDTFGLECCPAPALTTTTQQHSNAPVPPGTTLGNHPQDRQCLVIGAHEVHVGTSAAPWGTSGHGTFLWNPQCMGLHAVIEQQTHCGGKTTTKSSLLLPFLAAECEHTVISTS